MIQLKKTILTAALAMLAAIVAPVAQADIVKVKVITDVISTGLHSEQTYMFPNFNNVQQIVHTNDDWISGLVLVIGVNDANYNATTGVGDLIFTVTQTTVMEAQKVKIEVQYMLPTPISNGLTGGTYELTGFNTAPSGTNPVASIIVDEQLLPGASIAYAALQPGCGANCKKANFGDGSINIPVPEALASYGFSSNLSIPLNATHISTGKLKLAKPAVPACPGNLNGDTKVDSADLGILLGAYGQIGPNPSDLNGDNKVDGADLGIILGSYGPCP